MGVRKKMHKKNCELKEKKNVLIASVHTHPKQHNFKTFEQWKKMRPK
jgi:hypothetical protein